MNQEVFLSFLEPISDRFRDLAVNEIRINPNGSLWEERNGEVCPITGIELHPAMIEFAVGSLSGEYNLPLNHRYPKMDVRLEDGSRVAVLAPPLVSPGYAVTIRRFPQAFTLEKMIECGSVTEQQAEQMHALIQDRQTFVIGGAARAGKTTLARVLLNLIPHPGEKLVLVEQPAELNLAFSDVRDIIPIEVRDATPGAPEFSAVDALKAALRHSPDRIILGELRGGEAVTFLHALNTGHSGSVTTTHANSAGDALERIVTLARQGDPTMPRDVIIDYVGRSLDAAIHISHVHGQRRVSEIVRVIGVDPDHRKVLTEPYQ